MSVKNKPIDVFKHIDMSGGPDSCHPFTGGLNKEGRPYFTVDGKKVLAYRLTYELVTGDKLGDRILRHTCDNEVCCNYRHGIPGDHQQNMDDMKERERHGLSHHLVRAIKKMIANGQSDEIIASLTGNSRKTINNIRNGINYSHVKENEDD